MDDYEQDVDPIYGNRIEKPFLLGKTIFSLMSLYDWFLTRKCFINPMTNNLLSTTEQNSIVEKFMEENLLPNMNYSKMTSHKIVLIMERHKIHLNEILRVEDKIKLLKNRLETNKFKLKKARKPEKYEEIIKKIKEKISFQEIFLQNLKTN